VISGFAPGDKIDLTQVSFDSGGSAQLLSGNVLHVVEHGVAFDLHLDPAQNLRGAIFHLQNDGTGGTLITEENNAPCYCAGTLIATVRGEIAVEELAIGDEVLTAHNGPRPIKWIGRRSYAGRFARGAHILPVCFKAGALGVNRPRRDLWVSPHHAMFLDGVLIEAIDLANGASVFQADRVERVDYFHIELETHDVIVAEGAFSESFVDDDSRAMFHNASEFAARYPDMPAAPARYCAPRRAFGAKVEMARKRIAQRARVSYVPPPVPDTPRALVVDTRVPVLGHDGGSNAVLDHIRALQNAGFAVSFFALDGADQDLKALSSLGITLLRGAFGEVARQHAGQFDLVYLHRVATATRCLKQVRQYFNAQVIYSVADLHHLRVKAQSQLDHVRSTELIEQAQNLALQEITAALGADCVVTHSVSEAEQLQQIPSIAAARKVRVIPWALSAAPVRLPFGKRSGLAFIGGFAHAPNVDAARWLVHEIMPLVWREAPEVECLIAGSGLSDDLHQELTQARVAVLGRVDQLGDVFWRVRLTVAPLRFGAGLKDKVLRSMAAGLPCIGTPEAFSGMQGLPATISNDCEAQTASDLAAAIVRMHREQEANARCAAVGLDYIAAFYNRARIDALIGEMAQPALDHYRARTNRGSGCAVLQFGAPPVFTTTRPRQVVFR
jgi:glycosyltransferase involved in cell wall biosynthesis